MKILIPNATSPKNVGDLAMLSALISLFKKNDSLTVHSTESKLYKNLIKPKTYPTLYSWAAFENRSFLTRLNRTFKLLSSYYLFENDNLIIDKSLRALICDYKKADLVVFAGGGYLRSQKGISQTLNLLMTLLLFNFGKKTRAKKIIAPISFGPFAYKWQEKYAAKVLKGFDLVAAREKYSYDLLQRNGVDNLIRSSDNALFLNPAIKERKRSRDFILGFTIRKWLKENEQQNFEKAFINAIISFSKKTQAKIQPIVQVDAPEYGDVDFDLTKQISNKLIEAGVAVKPIVRVIDLKNTATIYQDINLLLGMRMHSNILAAVHYTPFVAIAYEHKTRGIASDLGLENYCIDIEKVTRNRIIEKLDSAYKNIKQLEDKLKKVLENLRLTEKKKWQKILRS